MTEPKDDSQEVVLTPGGQKKIGTLANLKDMNLSSAIRDRGGGQSQVDQVRTDYQSLKVGELANLAATGDAEAETAIKILKQAKRKREKYDGR